jgi:Outer membrane protein and related peptidoglycan-associated (lipo)proteins
MKIVHRLLLVLLISVFLFGCGGKKGSTTEGKLVDGQGQPLSGISVTFKQVRPVAGNEQLEARTGIDGIFRMSGLMPDSEYIIVPVSDKWTTKVTIKITTGKEGQPLVLSSPIVIRFNILANGTIIDTKTGLQWLIYTATDVNAGSVINTVKNIKEGGFNDWRLPTKAELLDLQDKTTSSTEQSESQSANETCCAWTAERNSDKVEWEFYIDDGNDLWTSGKMPPNDRIVIVRNYSGTPATAQAPTVVVPSPVVVPPPQAADSPASPAPAAVTATAVSEKKDAVGAAPAGDTVIVRFDSKKATMNTEDLAALKVFYTKVKDTSGRILIEGHSDAGGGAISTMKNSVDLALSTLSLLKKMGLSDKAKVELKGMGDTKPVADNKTPEGRQQNRRVELTFISE